jgi:hypothetical protein
MCSVLGLVPRRQLRRLIFVHPTPDTSAEACGEAAVVVKLEIGAH